MNITSVHEQIPWQALLALLRLEGRREALRAVDRARARAARDPRRQRRPGRDRDADQRATCSPTRGEAGGRSSEIPLGRWGEVADVARAVALGRLRRGRLRRRLDALRRRRHDALPEVRVTGRRLGLDRRQRPRPRRDGPLARRPAGARSG